MVGISVDSLGAGELLATRDYQPRVASSSPAPRQSTAMPTIASPRFWLTLAMRLASL